MLSLSTQQMRRALFVLVTFHIFIICASNYLVQIPLEIFGFHNTWGAFSFPFVYLATDLTVRIFGQSSARKIILKAMLPALLLSYLMGVIFHQGGYLGLDALQTFNSFVFRISFASFIAYLIGQLMDITVFAKLRATRSWWVAPAASTLLGNSIDTLVFFSVAFYGSTDMFMATHWPEIAFFDYMFKVVVSLALFLPIYGMLLKYLEQRLLSPSLSEALRKTKNI
ncbi:hypothetical protein PCNPT3_05795 [Psychromonas sp. CNPT3]|uniref:7-cyano-7-deazaguanine/7-aminomethyl-7- deazaguanine transporter n=1 Tax=Psychromonas sp. CNPT3 TaxID=314282 RepID=UPI00006E4257|nr:7-cyano-7-deazaguanine/7-aminomethyl-7-deazaguanine transporter [Psychromonas sp. CNPT3]AGH81101.1 hypothetical protein PCNPT3_05795 [Psychromonas sp. CNPT3]